MAEAKGQRGKAAEKIVEIVLKKLNTRSNFAYHRLADTRSARNFLAANPGDFVYTSNGRMGFIEVKSTEHPFRVAKDKISQLPTLHKFDMAGASNMILIHHSKENVWRLVQPASLEAGPPSWDLRSVPTWPTAEAALLSTGYFS